MPSSAQPTPPVSSATSGAAIPSVLWQPPHTGAGASITPPAPRIDPLRRLMLCVQRWLPLSREWVTVAVADGYADAVALLRAEEGSIPGSPFRIVYPPALDQLADPYGAVEVTDQYPKARRSFPPFIPVAYDIERWRRKRGVWWKLGERAYYNVAVTALRECERDHPDRAFRITPVYGLATISDVHDPAWPADVFYRTR